MVPLPKISIITPTWNSQASIRKTLDSIKAQDQNQIEHIIIDNMSLDNTKEIVFEHYKNVSFNWRFLAEKDMGISDAFNKGIKAARGDVIAILNSDDFYLNHQTLKNVLDIFDSKNVEIVFGSIFFEDKSLGSSIRRPLLTSPSVAMPFNHPAFFCRRTLYEKYGYFDLNFKFAMDFEWVCRFWKDFTESKISSFEIKEFPLVHMASGGASYTNELSTLKETRIALIKNQIWNRAAFFHYYYRLFKFFLKKILLNTGSIGNWIVQIWRKWKWR